MFVRWMNGTCIECLPQKVEGEDELYVFTFFTDISVNNETIDLVQTIHYNIKNTLTNMQRYLNRWKKYRSIWKVDKVRSFKHLSFVSRQNLKNCSHYYIYICVCPGFLGNHLKDLGYVTVFVGFAILIEQQVLNIRKLQSPSAQYVL